MDCDSATLTKSFDMALLVQEVIERDALLPKFRLKLHRALPTRTNTSKVSSCAYRNQGLVNRGRTGIILGRKKELRTTEGEIRGRYQNFRPRGHPFAAANASKKENPTEVEHRTGGKDGTRVRKDKTGEIERPFTSSRRITNARSEEQKEERPK